MMYIFKYKRRFFWEKISVIGHRYEEKTNKMILFLEKGQLREIKKWSDCEIFLDVDWVLETKKQIEREAGRSVPLEV